MIMGIRREHASISTCCACCWDSISYITVVLCDPLVVRGKRPSLKWFSAFEAQNH